MIVVDASVLVAVLLREDAAPSIETRFEMAKGPLCAPDLIDLEVINAVRRKTAPSRLGNARGDAAFAAHRRLPLRRYPHLRFLDRIWALRHNITPYDANYVALAEYLGAPLLTRDRRLASTGGHKAQIELI